MKNPFKPDPKPSNAKRVIGLSLITLGSGFVVKGVAKAIRGKKQ